MKILLLAHKKALGTIRLVAEAEKMKLDLAAAQVNELQFVTDHERTGVFLHGQDIVKTFDAVIIRDIYPYISEALTVAKIFADARKIVIDKSFTDQGYSISKMHDYLLLSQREIPVPQTIQIFKNKSLFKKTARQFGFPLILKGIHGSHGNHVFKVEDSKQLEEKRGMYQEGELLLQEYIQNDCDYRVIVIGYHALPYAIKRFPTKNDFRTNFDLGSTWQKIPLARELKSISEKSAKILRREFAAVDIRYKGALPLVLEVNRRPGFTGFEDATTINVAKIFLEYVQSAHQTKK